MNETRELPLGIVLANLRSYQKLVHLVMEEPSVVETEFTFAAPLYKATQTIVDGLTPGISAIDKFDVYYENGILDERVRVKLAAAFRERYIQQHPRSEGSDVFKASADVLQFRFGLGWPADSDGRDALLKEIEKHPHDTALVDDIRGGAGVAQEHLRARFALYLDHVYNPRRRELPEVADVMFGSRSKEPVVIELLCDGALPGMFVNVLEPLIDEVDGALVWLPG